MSISTIYDCALDMPSLLSQLSHSVFARRNLKTQEERDAAAIHNSTVSPLLQLPSELRHMIFEYVIGYRCIYIAPIFAFDSHDTPKKLSLPLVCSQVFAESQPILRSNTFFRFDYIFELETWVARRSQAQCEAVRNVRINGSVMGFIELARRGSPKTMAFYLPNARVLEF